MSSGATDPNKKLITFEVNHSGVAARFTLAHIDGNELNPDRIMLKMVTQAVNLNRGDSSENSTSVIVDKSYTKVLSHWFKHAAELMDEWYKNNGDVAERPIAPASKTGDRLILGP